MSRPVIPELLFRPVLHPWSEPVRKQKVIIRVIEDAELNHQVNNLSSQSNSTVLLIL